MGFTYRRSTGLKILALAPIALLSIGAGEDVDKIYAGQTIDITPNVPINATINGQPVTLLIQPEAINVPTMNADQQERLALKPSMIVYDYLLGKVTLSFRTDVAQLDFGSGVVKRRTAFNKAQTADPSGCNALTDVKSRWCPSAQISAQANGIAGAGTLPHGVVRFILAPAQPGERVFRFPLADTKSMLGPENGSRNVTLLKLGPAEEDVIEVSFSLSRPETLVNAGAGALLSTHFGGSFAGEARDMPINYGISRPVRPLAFTTQVAVGDLPLQDFVVRVADYGSLSAIKDPAAESANADENADPNEIVVTGQRKKKKPVRKEMTIGLASMKTCSTLTFDYVKREIRLSCL